MYRDLIKQIIVEQEAFIGPLAWHVAKRVPGLLIHPGENKILACPENTDVVLNLIDQFEQHFGPCLGQVAREAARRLSLRIFLHDNTSGLIESILQKSHLQLKKEFASFDDIDACIIEMSDSSNRVEQWLAKAVLVQKPTLCLYQKNNEPRALLINLRKPGLPKNIIIKNYTSRSIPTILERFVSERSVLPVELATPSIKFTLRLTPDVDQYLEWNAEKSGDSKANLLRQWLRERISQDDSYQENRT